MTPRTVGAQAGEIARSLLCGLLAEGKRAPYTVALLTLLCALAVLVVWPDVQRGSATEATVTGIKGQVADLSRKLGEVRDQLRLDAVRTRISLIDGQIYQLEREDTACLRAGRLTPDVVTSQLHKLLTEKDLAERELEALMDRQVQAERESALEH